MKKIFLSIFFAAGIFVLWSHGEMVWSNRLFQDEPRVHTIQKGEYLSQLAKQYYGDAQRWRELALINRAPNPDHVEAGEKILIPAANAVTEIGRARTLTKVNALLTDQEKLMRQPSPPITETSPSTTSTPSAEVTTGNGTVEPGSPVEKAPAQPLTRETGFPWMWAGFGAFVLALAGFVIYRRRQNAEQEANFALKKKENGFDDFLHHRRHGESAPARTSPVAEKKDDDEAKGQATGNDDFRSRRRYSESVTATN